MTDDPAQRQRELARVRINSQTAKIPWRELQRFFAAGKVMLVADGLDLVEVARAVEQDDLERVRNWTERREIAPVADAEARRWIEADSSLWAVVVKPWVLVQTITSE